MAMSWITIPNSCEDVHYLVPEVLKRIDLIEQMRQRRMPKDLSYYRALPYGRPIARETRDDGSVYFVAWIREIPWIRIHGSDEPEARTRLVEVFEDAIEAMIESRDEIPEPVLWPDSVGTVPAPRARWRRTETAKPTLTVDQDPAEPWLPLRNNPEPAGV